MTDPPPMLASRARGRRLLARLALGGVLAAALLTWFLRRVDLPAVRAVLGGLHPGWVIAAAALQVSALVLRGVRWRSLLARAATPPLATVLAATFMGWVALVLVPARLGDLARVWLLARRHPVDRSFAFGAQQLERVFDLVAVLALVATFLASAPITPATGESAGWRSALERGEIVVLALVASAILVLIAALGAAPRLERFVDARLTRESSPHGWTRLASRLAAFLHGLTAVRSLPALGLAIVQTVAIWLAILAAHLSLFRAFDLDLPALAAAPVVAFVIVGALVPTPAAIGSYHAAVQLALASLFGVPLAVATGYALVSHAVAYLPNLVIGSALIVSESTAKEMLGRPTGGTPG